MLASLAVTFICLVVGLLGVCLLATAIIVARAA